MLVYLWSLMGEAMERMSYVLGEPWVFMVLVACMAVLAIVHNAYPNRIPNLIKSTFNERITRQIMREEMVFSHRASWLLLFVSAVVFAVVTSLIMRGAGQNFGFREFSWVLLAVSVWVMTRQVMRMLLSVLSKKDFGFQEFNYVSASIYKLIGLALLPLAFIMAFLPERIGTYGGYVVFTLLVLAAVFRLLRGWRIGRHHNGLSYYLIFYLCALELIPTLVVVRAMISNVEIL